MAAPILIYILKFYYVDNVDSLTNDGPDTLDHNVETALDDGELTTSKESNGDGRIEIS